MTLEIPQFLIYQREGNKSPWHTQHEEHNHQEETFNPAYNNWFVVSIYPQGISLGYPSQL